MTFAYLKHMVSVARALAPDASILVFGSTSAFGTYPDLPDEVPLYEATLDSDFITEPWNEEISIMITKAIGKDSPFFSIYGYYADIVRPDACDNFPPGFRERLVPIEGFEKVFSLEPHDMAVAKLLAGRPKDIRLLAELLRLKKLDEAVLRKRLWDTPMIEKWIVKTHQVLEEVVAEAAKAATDRSGKPLA